MSSCSGRPGLSPELPFPDEPLGTECTVGQSADLLLICRNARSNSFPGKPEPVFYRLARRRPLERSANFGDCLVAIFVQFLESLLQRPKFSGAFGRPFPIDIESVCGRWTGRRSLRGRQRRLHRCVVTVSGRHICTPYKLESGRIRSGRISVWSRAGVASLHPAVCCLDARPGSIWWQKMDGGGNPRILTDLLFHE
jgi:hypothetical protein